MFNHLPYITPNLILTYHTAYHVTHVKSLSLGHSSILHKLTYHFVSNHPDIPHQASDLIACSWTRMLRQQRQLLGLWNFGQSLEWVLRGLRNLVRPLRALWPRARERGSWGSVQRQLLGAWTAWAWGQNLGWISVGAVESKSDQATSCALNGWSWTGSRSQWCFQRIEARRGRRGRRCRRGRRGERGAVQRVRRQRTGVTHHLPCIWLFMHSSQKHPAISSSSSHAAPQAPPHLPQLPAPERTSAQLRPTPVHSWPRVVWKGGSEPLDARKPNQKWTARHFFMMSDDKINVDDDSSRVTLFYHLSVCIYLLPSTGRNRPTRWYVSRGMSAISHLSACEVSSCFGHKWHWFWTPKLWPIFCIPLITCQV